VSGELEGDQLAWEGPERVFRGGREGEKEEEA
jgi:hypothetical protein